MSACQSACSLGADLLDMKYGTQILLQKVSKKLDSKGHRSKVKVTKVLKLLQEAESMYKQVF